MTTKQKLAAKKFLENPSLPMNRIMREAGYSENTVVDPSNLTNSKGWKELMEKHLPDNKLLEVHESALEATKVITSHTEPDYVVPDYQIRLKAVELGYKVKGKTADNIHNTQINLDKGNKITFVNFTNGTESQSSL